MRELVTDCFAGGGGASLGIETALGRPVDFAVNHDREAIAMHIANHPSTRHFCEDVWDVDPRELAAGRQVGLGWFSPDCTYHSKARGGKPFRDRNRARRVRGLAWLVVRWAKAVRPRVIMLENVEEFSDWGPLLPDGRPCPMRRGMTFRRWHRQIENLGYQVDMRELRACDYGAPTTRKRLFVIARCNGGELVFPEATHGRGLTPYRTAAECIDWSIPCPSIFDRKRPLAEATLRRIARGIMRYVVNNPQPFIVPVTHPGDSRLHGIDEPFRTITGAHRGELAMVRPFVVPMQHDNRPTGVDEPLQTITTQGNKFNVVVPTLINTRNGERPGQDPRCRDIERPYPTVTAAGSQGALVAAFLAKHYGGHENDGTPLAAPTSTVTAKDHHALVAAHVMKFYGTSVGLDAREPLHTITAGAEHFAEVRAFLTKFAENSIGHRADEPIHTVMAGAPRFGLVTVMIGGEPYAIVDIGMRMLTPRELYRAQSFPDSFIIDPIVDGKPLTKTAQVRMVGNSVPPAVAEALVRANVVEQREEQVA